MAHVERRARAHRFPEVEGRRGREVGPGLVRDVVGEEVVRAARSHVQDQVELARRQTKGSNRVQNTGKQTIIQWANAEEGGTPSGRRAPSWIQPPKGCRTSSPFRRNPRSCFQGPLSAAGPRPRRT